MVFLHWSAGLCIKQSKSTVKIWWWTSGKSSITDKKNYFTLSIKVDNHRIWRTCYRFILSQWNLERQCQFFIEFWTYQTLPTLSTFHSKSIKSCKANARWKKKYGWIDFQNSIFHVFCCCCHISDIELEKMYGSHHMRTNPTVATCMISKFILLHLWKHTINF